MSEGTSASDADAFLVARGFETSGYVADERVIDAVLRDVEARGVTTRALAVRVEFDEADRVERVSVRDVFTGP